MAVATISPRNLAAKRQTGEPVDLVDVRTPAEFRELHCTFARNVPLGDLNVQAETAGKAGPLYVICRSGGRGQQACEKFAAAGFTNVINVDGGTLAWAECGLPVERGRKAVSLERQVRIAAGSLVLLGLALGYWLHPAGLGLAAFVGAGLVFAGITDTCGMGLFLARMPWNRTAAAACAVK